MFRDLVQRSFHGFVPFWLVLLGATWFSALVGALIAYRFQGDRERHSVAGFLRFCFPRVILRHPSCRIDAWNVSIRLVIDPLMLAPLMFSNAVIAIATYSGLTGLFGTRTQTAEPVWLGIVLLAVALVLEDFMTFWMHYLMHKVSPMWEVHKVHHSAEFLLPISNQRFHPFETLIDHASTVVPIGTFLGASIYGLGLPSEDNWILGRNLYGVLNILSFYHLRHSHIQMSYGWLERYVMSPAQHQLHHSKALEHWNKNFGLFFSCWDRMFGTVVYSHPDDRLRLGLPEPDQTQLNTAWKLYTTPVVSLARTVRRAWVPQPGGRNPEYSSVREERAVGDD